MATKHFVKNFSDLLPTENNSPYKKILAVGDIHGSFSKFLSVWNQIKITDDDLVIFLGDYIDRGSEIGETLKFVMNLQDKKNIILLRGNHEQMMLNAINDKENLDMWMSNGGRATLEALTYLKDEDSNIDVKVYNFLNSLPLYHKIKIGGRDYFFCHAGVDVNKNLDEQDEKSLLWSREKFFENYTGSAVIISGHSPVQYFFENTDLKPFRVPNRNILMTDTGAFLEDGRLSAVDILSGELYQNKLENKARILFVCSGNTCRSPMAKFIMQKLVADVGLTEKIFVDSAGCNTSGGAALNEDAKKVLEENNIPCDEHISKTFTRNFFKKFDYVIAMDETNLFDIKMVSYAAVSHKIRLLKDFNFNEIIVDDPFGSPEKYKIAYEKIYLGCSALLEEIKLKFQDE